MSAALAANFSDCARLAADLPASALREEGDFDPPLARKP